MPFLITRRFALAIAVLVAGTFGLAYTLANSAHPAARIKQPSTAGTAPAAGTAAVAGTSAGLSLGTAAALPKSPLAAPHRRKRAARPARIVPRAPLAVFRRAPVLARRAPVTRIPPAKPKAKAPAKIDDSG